MSITLLILMRNLFDNRFHKNIQFASISKLRFLPPEWRISGPYLLTGDYIWKDQPSHGVFRPLRNTNNIREMAA